MVWKHEAITGGVIGAAIDVHRLSKATLDVKQRSWSDTHDQVPLPVPRTGHRRPPLNTLRCAGFSPSLGGRNPMETGFLVDPFESVAGCRGSVPSLILSTRTGGRSHAGSRLFRLAHARLIDGLRGLFRSSRCSTLRCLPLSWPHLRKTASRGSSTLEGRATSGTPEPPPSEARRLTQYRGEREGGRDRGIRFPWKTTRLRARSSLQSRSRSSRSERIRPRGDRYPERWCATPRGGNPGHGLLGKRDRLCCRRERACGLLAGRWRDRGSRATARSSCRDRLVRRRSTTRVHRRTRGSPRDVEPRPRRRSRDGCRPADPGLDAHGPVSEILAIRAISCVLATFRRGGGLRTDGSRVSPWTIPGRCASPISRRGTRGRFTDLTPARQWRGYGAIGGDEDTLVFLSETRRLETALESLSLWRRPTSSLGALRRSRDVSCRRGSDCLRLERG